LVESENQGHDFYELGLDSKSPYGEVIRNSISNRFCDRHLSQDAVYAMLVDLVRNNMKVPKTGLYKILMPIYKIYMLTLQ